MMSQTSTTRRRLSTFVTDESGPTTVEYAVMLSLVAVSCIGAALSLGSAATETFSDASEKLASSVSAKSGNGKGFPSSGGNGKGLPGNGGKGTGGNNGWKPQAGGSSRPQFGGNSFGGNSSGKRGGK